MNMLNSLNLRGMVFNENGEAKTTSFAVADAFGKRHSDVLKAIKNMRCSDNFAKRNFALCFEISELQNGKPRKFYQMTKDGWMFLVMGFTGEKADAIKEQFIEAFNWMATQLTQVFQSKWARYNQVSLEYKTRKDHVSCSARDMRNWRDEKPIYEGEMAQLEIDLQPQLI
ncbi:Rha family transcriptional regulator [Acinetobacter junii]|uniref:Rha family transcriptional regulator n=1 Tax=Acinetobacter junii TaxID=40215 RepID=A0AAW5R8I4_ACIJU|nr:Rha family transcriptional regulator [Acinetobacter junii]MCU4395819.1 Rha family transcriptional regulator [Acinetobacter junii]